MTPNYFNNKARPGIPAGQGISVVIPTYNATFDLIDAIDSVYEQGLNPHQFEIIVSNDYYATDETGKPTDLELSHLHERVFKELNRRIKAGLYPNLKIIDSGETPKNYGQSAAKNAAMKVSKFNYIACLDADDMYVFDSEFLEKEGSFLEHGVQILHNQHEIAFVDCNMIEFGHVSPKIPTIYLTSEAMHKFIMKYGVISNIAIFRKSDAFNKHVNGFNENLSTVEDYAFFICLLNSRLLRELPIKLTQTPHFYLYRKYSENAPNVSNRSHDNVTFTYKLIRDCLPYFQLFYEGEFAMDIIEQHLKDLSACEPEDATSILREHPPILCNNTPSLKTMGIK